jgi:hypothetical protein
MFEGDILREMLTKEMGCGSGPTRWRSCSRVRRWGLTITNLVAPCPVDKSYPAFPGKLTKPMVGSTGRCNTLGFQCCPDRRCGSGETGSSWGVVRGGQEGVVGAVEGRGVHQRHRPGITQASRLHSRDARSHRRLLCARAAQAKMCTHPGREGGDLPGARYRRIPSCNRRSAGPLRLHRVPGGEPQRRSQKLPGSEGGREGVGESPPSQEMPARNKPLLARCGSTEATGRLVARADLRLAEKTSS